jgi:FMN phosphatase YigB (HAD superfamily)
MQPCLDRHGLSDYFDMILPCGEQNVNKHTPQPYQMVLQALEITPTEAVFVDDFYGNVLGAKQAGVTTVGVYDSVGDANWAQMTRSADLSVLSLNDLLITEDDT